MRSSPIGIGCKAKRTDPMPDNEPATTETETPELKPCPFCGEAEGWHSTSQETTLERIMCGVCSAIGPGRRTKPDAISAWNKRAG